LPTDQQPQPAAQQPGTQTTPTGQPGYGVMPQPTGYENWLGQNAFRAPMERTFIDKILSRKDVEQMMQLIMKEDLTRQDLMRLLNMLTATELKLANFGEYDRYLVGKYYTWVRDLVKVAEFLYDYVDKIDTYHFSPEGTIEIKDTLEQVKKMMLHDVKFSADIFLYLVRSSLSISGLAFDTLSKQRYEYEYGNWPMPQMAPANKSKSIWPFRT